MPIQLDKILSDILNEKYLYPNYFDPNKKDEDVKNAWDRVAKKNNLSLHETRSIFKVLQKKYEQEKIKGTSSWKLYNIMNQINKKFEVKQDIKTENDSDVPMEDDEEYEMLEVQEEEEPSLQTQAATEQASSSSDNENVSKTSVQLPEKDEKLASISLNQLSQKQPPASVVQNDERKLLNTMAPSFGRGNIVSPTATSAAALQKKGIIVKRANISQGNNHSSCPNAKAQSTSINVGSNVHSKTGFGSAVRVSGTLLEVGKTIQLPESIKRKLSEEQNSTNTKKLNLSCKIPMQQMSVNVKQDQEDQLGPSVNHGVSIVSLPSTGNGTIGNNIVNGIGHVSCGPNSSTGATIASTSTNGLSPRVIDIDFKNDIFDTNANSNGGSNGIASNNKSTNTGGVTTELDIENILPPTFFRNLCNSTRHEAFGLYVANVMNRLSTRAATKLEVGILRAILDVQSDELEQ